MMRTSTGHLKEICLVTPGNLSSNPRLVKEASALLEGGYGVRIVAANIIPSLSPFDAEIFARLGCEVTRVDYRRPFWKRLARGIRHRLARKFSRRWGRMNSLLGSFAHHPLTPALAHEAVRSPADLYIAHNLAALPAAGSAAIKHNRMLGFDAEDYHCGELGPREMSTSELRIRKSIEGYWLPKCAHLTSASPGISEAYQRDYHVRMHPILNVFPLSQAPKQPGIARSWRGQLPSLYWFSQTIGENRGLEQMVAILARMKTKAELFLRGNASPGYLTRLLARATELGGNNLAARIRVLPVAEPDAMARLSAEHDIGLSVETATTPNRDICLTNKIFVYLLAGIPVLLSRTAAQIELATQLGSAAILVDLHSADSTATALDQFLASREAQTRARKEAWRLGHERFNWDVEQEKFLRSVERALSVR